MANETDAQPTAGSTWQATQVYVMAVVCLLVGLVIGYLFRGSASPAPAAPVAQAINPAQTGAAAAGLGGHVPSLEEMRQMADKTAAPLLEQLKSDPANPLSLFRSAAFTNPR